MMDEDRTRDLIGEVAGHGERLPVGASATELRLRAGPSHATGSAPGRRSTAGPQRRFGHLAAIAWVVGIAALAVSVVVLVGIPSSRHTDKQAQRMTTTTMTKPTTETTFGRPTSTTMAPSPSTTRPPSPSTTMAPPPSQGSAAQQALSHAVDTTDSAGNFDLSFELTGSGAVTGHGAVNLEPSIAMTLDDVLGATLSFDGYNAWEQLGSTGWDEYTLPAFSSYAEGAVGKTSGALGTLGFCSPTGLFDLSQNSIGPTTEVGPATVDGQSTTEYQVSIDPTTFLDAPGITSGEQDAMQSAITVLGTGAITDDVYVDSSGDILRSVSTIDGATLQVDLSNFGDAGSVTLPPQQNSIDAQVGSMSTQPVPGSTGNSAPTTLPPSSTTTTTTAVPSTTTTAPQG